MTKRDQRVLLVVLAVGLVIGFWMLLLSPQRKAAGEAEARVAAAQASLLAAQQQVAAGRKAQTAFQRDRTTIVKLGRVVPETDDVPTLLTQLQALARKQKVTFTSYAIDSAGGAAAAGAASTSTVPQESKTGSQTGAGSTAAVAPLFPPGSVEIAGGLGRTPIALELTGTYFELEGYLRSVQRFAVLSQKSSRTNGRLMIVDGFSYKDDEEEDEDTASTTSAKSKAKLKNAWRREPELRATLSASVYFAPPLDAPKASAAGSAASSAPTPAAGTTAPSGSTTGTAAIGGVR